MYNRIYDILTAKWLIHQDVIMSYLPIFVSFLRGNSISLADFKDDKKPFVVSGTSNSINTVDRWNLDDISVPENSVAIIPIDGIMTSWKSMQIESFIHTAESNPNICSILFLVSTPGGMVFYTDILALAIKNSPLPSVAFVLQMAASAGMWLVSGTDRIIMSSELDMMGSIGVMTSYVDYTRLLRDKLGIDIIDFYATLSTRKNELSRVLQDVSKTMDEKQAAVAAHLDPVNAMFHNTIQENMGIKSDSEVFTGATYYGNDAVKMGLAHEIGTIQTALDAAYKLGLKNKVQLFIKNQKYT